MSPRTARGRRRLRTPDDGAQVGIGTMIVFIATILVAAVAAAVLIDTSNMLQERASQTGRDTTKAVASNLLVKDVIGLRAASGGGEPLASLEIHVTLAPGAKEVDVGQLVVLLGNRTSLKTLTHGDTAGADVFTATALRDADGSFGSAPVMNAGDLVLLSIDLTPGANDLPVHPRESVLLTLIPESGTDVSASFETPQSYGSSLVIQLR